MIAVRQCITRVKNDRSPTILKRIIIGSHRRRETKQGIEGKIDRFRSGRVRVRDRVRVRYN